MAVDAEEANLRAPKKPTCGFAGDVSKHEQRDRSENQ